MLTWPQVSYAKCEETRRLLLTKLVNGEITALAAPQFMASQCRTRAQLLTELAKVGWVSLFV